MSEAQHAPEGQVIEGAGTESSAESPMAAWPHGVKLLTSVWDVYRRH